MGENSGKKSKKKKKLGTKLREKSGNPPGKIGKNQEKILAKNQKIKKKEMKGGQISKNLFQGEFLSVDQGELNFIDIKEGLSKYVFG